MERADLFAGKIKQWTEVFMRRSMRNFVLYAKRNDLNMTQVAALFHVNRKGRCSISNIGDDIGITSPAASPLVSRLVLQGFVARSEDPNDRRLKQIALTKRGEAILQEGIYARQRFIEELVELMSPAEMDQCITALNIMLEKTRQLERQSRPQV
jgi:DNA-binding MarR family transcriptional regulator